MNWARSVYFTADQLSLALTFIQANKIKVKFPTDAFQVAGFFLENQNLLVYLRNKATSDNLRKAIASLQHYEVLSGVAMLSVALSAPQIYLQKFKMGDHVSCLWYKD